MRSIDHIEEIEKRFDRVVEVEKFNPWHDAKGRFSTANGATSFTYAPGRSKAHDLAIQREKERTAAAAGATATSTVTPKKNLVTGLGQEHAENVEKLVAKAPKEVQDVWNKYGTQVEVSENNLTGRGAYCDAMRSSIHLNIEKDAAGTSSKPPYETTLHESGHAIDHAIARKVGYNFAVEYNGGEFESSLKKEATAYIKAHQKKMEAETGGKVSIQAARDSLGKQMRKEGALSTGDVSDMLEGATNGKFYGSAGHGKSYWTGRQTYWGKTQGHSVATEAFAEMFSATTTNPGSLSKIKEVFPESYNIFTKMCAEAVK